MKLSECKLGTVVQGDGCFKRSFKIDMIVGISENTQGEAIPVVQWQNGESSPCHHQNINLYEE